VISVLSLALNQVKISVVWELKNTVLGLGLGFASARSTILKLFTATRSPESFSLNAIML
jgi:hypothetical protein